MSLKFKVGTDTARSVHSASEIEELFCRNYLEERFVLNLKLGVGPATRQIVNVQFKNFQGRACLESILQVAESLWKLKYHKPLRVEESECQQKK